MAKEMRQVCGLEAQHGLSIIWVIGLWVALNLMDWGITTVHLGRNGIEANALFASMGGVGFVVAKMLVPVAVAIILWRARRLQWLWGCCVGMAVIVVWNCQWLLLA